MLKRLSVSSKFWIIIGIILIIVAILFLSRKVDKTILVIDHVTVEKKDDIKAIKDSLVIPILYSNVQLLNTFGDNVMNSDVLWVIFV